MHRTKTQLKVAAVLHAAVDERHYGYPLGKAAGVRPGVLYPMLSRWLDQGWLADDWEDPAVATGQGRPRRRYYTVTPAGREALSQLLRRTR